MAAPEAAWNRVDVPWPAGSSAVAVASQHPAGPRLGCRDGGWDGVEQCLKRLWKMNLVGCIETLAELIPRIQYRCVLQSLISLYGVLSTTLHLVSETQQMPYIKGFTFPSDITSFLGVNLPSEVKKQKARMLTAKRPTRWLKKLFPATPEAVSELREKRGFVTYASALDNHSIPADDIGEPVLATTDSTGKAFCHSATGF
ncbi:hypothetical protein ASZ78_014497 [Callipepla squamata]|uniref:Uncharacterized protein n=1 Tax=Callipepla squamata TaxID=9009 RepID=A0A226N4T8_CALSU|nr:hypothetical protein ASZ78_014497 [Callipepla squamata]